MYFGPLPTAPPTTITTTPCAYSEVYCAADAKCIPGKDRCNHRDDCSDGEDEYGCGKNELLYVITVRRCWRGILK